MMRTAALLALMAFGPAAHAQTPAAPATCTDVQVGSAQSYACINAQLGATAQATHDDAPDAAGAPVTSSSPGNVVGTFNEGATRNRLGRNFSKSAVPFRPPADNPPALPPR